MDRQHQISRIRSQAYANYHHQYAQKWKYFYWATVVGLGVMSITIGVLGLRSDDSTIQFVSGSLQVVVGVTINILGMVNAGSLRRENEIAGDNYERLSSQYAKSDLSQTESNALDAQWDQYIDYYDAPPEDWIETEKQVIVQQILAERHFAAQLGDEA